MPEYFVEPSLALRGICVLPKNPEYSAQAAHALIFGSFGLINILAFTRPQSSILHASSSAIERVRFCQFYLDIICIDFSFSVATIQKKLFQLLALPDDPKKSRLKFQFKFQTSNYY